MGLFRKKEEVRKESAPRLPSLPEPSGDFLDQSEIPDVPPGLPEEIEANPMPFQQQKMIQQPIKKPDINELAKPTNKPLAHPLSDPSLYQGENNEALRYPLERPIRRVEIRDLPEAPKTREIDEDYEEEKTEEPKFIKSRPIHEHHQIHHTAIHHKPEPIPRFHKPVPKDEEPVFIRLDKFETTIEAFEEIKSKIIEIEDLLKKTREIKAREEEELASWEKEMQEIKMRIDSIDKNIFNKLD